MHERTFCTCIDSLTARKRGLKKEDVLEKLISMCLSLSHTCLLQNMSSFRSLTHLDLSKNLLQALPDSLHEFAPNLVSINLNSNLFEFLPLPLTKLTLLQVILISNNHLITIPHNFFMQLSQLRHLDVSNNKLSQLPSSLSYCYQLKSLFLGSVYGGNQIVSIDSIDWKNLPHLVDLDFSNNLLTSLPASLVSYKLWLKRLNVSNNRLTSIPRVLSTCPRLSTADFSRNYITFLPSDVTQAPLLELLDLTFNRICVLPGEILKCKSSCSILLSGNPFSNGGGPKITPMKSPGPPKIIVQRRLPHTSMRQRRFIPSLKELCLREIARPTYDRERIKLSEIPEILVPDLASMPKPCYYCDNLFIYEYISHFIDKCPILGYPQVPCHAHFCSHTCLFRWKWSRKKPKEIPRHFSLRRVSISTASRSALVAGLSSRRFSLTSTAQFSRKSLSSFYSKSSSSFESMCVYETSYGTFSSDW